MPAQHRLPIDTSVQFFRQEVLEFMPTTTKKVGVAEQERVSRSKSGNHSRHVEVVLARVFARQRGYAKQKSFRDVELDNVTADWR
jgi:hypothetical protein